MSQKVVVPDCIDGGRAPCPTCPVHGDCPHGRRMLHEKKSAVTEAKALADPIKRSKRKKQPAAV